MPNKFFVLTFVVAVFVVGILLYIYNPDGVEYKNPNEPKPAFCTADAKLCPDGSYVGRIAPSCDFAPCPETGTPEFEDGTIQE
jgi:hypothetical protein